MTRQTLLSHFESSSDLLMRAAELKPGLGGFAYN